MAKENILAFVIILSLLLFPGTGFGFKKIQTTQHIIVIDPGHGGSNQGLVSSGGLKEKIITAKLARKIARDLESRYNILMTRTGDNDISARDRIFIANKNHADLYLSIHLNRSNEPAGFFYYFDPPEHHEYPVSGSKSSWKSQPFIHQAGSKKATNAFLKIFSANKKTSRFYIEGAPVMLLEGATMPAILIEPLSISMLPQYQDEMDNILEEYALLISKSIDLYFQKK
ncbi:MAG: N-acetylmuramoyl-L-alanine amidase [Deltaproteobacteria bacterium]|nr:N-acetylmuramoyl-L-alanine amidase [Deltaproteobacteria bacterium]